MTRKFRKKPVVIEAMQFTGSNLIEISDFCPLFKIEIFTDGPWYIITTLEGDHRSIPGDWIVKGIKGEFYPVKDEIFRETYEEIP